MQNTARHALHAAVSLVALVFLLVPETRPVGRFLLAPLYTAMAVDSFIQSWRSGHLHKTLGEIAQNPPRSGALDTLAHALGFIAVMVWLL